MAWTLYDSAEYQRAADLFEEALDELDDTIDPSARELYLGLAQSLEMVQDYDEAIEAYEKALEFDRDDDLILSAIERLKQFR